MGRMKELAMEGGETRSSKTPIQFYDRKNKTTRAAPKPWTPNDDRPPCMRDTGPIEKVDKAIAHVLHQRMTLLGLKSRHHYASAHLILIALGLRTSQQMAPTSLTQLNRVEMGRLLDWCQTEWDTRMNPNRPLN